MVGLLVNELIALVDHIIIYTVLQALSFQRLEFDVLSEDIKSSASHVNAHDKCKASKERNLLFSNKKIEPSTTFGVKIYYLNVFYILYNLFFYIIIILF